MEETDLVESVLWGWCGKIRLVEAEFEDRDLSAVALSYENV